MSTKKKDQREGKNPEVPEDGGKSLKAHVLSLQILTLASGEDIVELMLPSKD